MRAAFITAVAAAFATTTLAAPLEKRGGYFDSNGQWVDDGYWAWSHGDQDSPFTPWSNGKPDGAPSNQDYSGNDGSFSYSGEATYFFQKGNAGACGTVHSDSDFVVAIDQRNYDGGSHCGSQVTIKNTNNGQTISAKVADMCPTCSSAGSLDLSEAAFQSLGDKSQGVLPIQWSFS